MHMLNFDVEINGSDFRFQLKQREIFFVMKSYSNTKSLPRNINLNSLPYSCFMFVLLSFHSWNEFEDWNGVISKLIWLFGETIGNYVKCWALFWTSKCQETRVASTLSPFENHKVVSDSTQTLTTSSGSDTERSELFPLESTIHSPTCLWDDLAFGQT